MTAQRYAIVDPRPTAEANPWSFYMPCEARRNAVAAGDSVKIIFTGIEDGECTERMWVQVTGVNDNGQLVGTLDNDPLGLVIEYGDEVVFDRHAIIDIHTNRADDPEETSVLDDRVFHRCWMDQRVWEGEEMPVKATNGHPQPEGYEGRFPWGGWMIVGADWEEGMPLEIGTPVIALRKDAAIAQHILGDEEVAVVVEKGADGWTSRAA